MYVPLRSKITRCDDSVSDYFPLVPCRAPQHARPRARLWFAPVRGLTLLCWLLFLSSSVPAADLADNGSPDFTADQAALPEVADNAPGSGEAEAGNSANGNMPPPAPVPGQQGVDRDGRPAWTQLEPGLAFGEFQLNDSEARLTALRIDPARFDFILCASSQDGRPARALSDWGEQYDLTAAINASMYLPDGSTSTGYMRQGGHVNNKRLVQRFGAFFVARPDSPNLPPAAILDRDSPDWRQRIDHYGLVVQNYRMINAERRILWAPGGPLYSISAVAQDGDGQILFLHCREPVEAYAFAQQLLHLPLDVRTVMYVEGGAQAGLLVRSASLRRELAGRHAVSFLVTGNLKATLPNVLGARRKATPTTTAPTPGTKPAQTADSPTARIPGQPPAEAAVGPDESSPSPAHVDPASTNTVPSPEDARK